MESQPLPSPPHRRHHSEIDMNSLRRISEALLLAQNRARLATERANRCERVLRMVLTHVNPQLARSMRSELGSSSSGLLVDTMSDWDMMQSMTQQQSASDALDAAASALPLPSHHLQSSSSSPLISGTDAPALSSHRRHSFDVREVVHEEPTDVSSSTLDSDAVLWASMVAPERNDDVAVLAKQIVANLRVAAVRGDQRVQKLNASMPSGATFVAGSHHRHRASRSSSSAQQLHGLATTSATAAGTSASASANWLETWKHRLFRLELYALTPLQFVAGILVGVAVGVSVTKQLVLLRRDGGSSTQLVKRLATCYTRRAGQPPATLRNFAFPGDDALSSCYVHPAAVEVA